MITINAERGQKDQPTPIGAYFFAEKSKNLVKKLMYIVKCVVVNFKGIPTVPTLVICQFLMNELLAANIVKCGAHTKHQHTLRSIGTITHD